MVQANNKSFFWVVALAAAFILFFQLGAIPLLDPDEPVYAETPKEMIAFHDYVSPRIFGEYWYDKPPLFYWLVAASFHMFGVSEFSARFPSAFLGLLTVLYVYFAASRLFGRRAGGISALILATSVEFFYLGKAAVTDITLNFCLTVALLSFLEKRYYLFYVFAGLATVAKGPIGLLFPGAILFLYFLLARRWHVLMEMKLLPGIFIYTLVALPWYAAMIQIHGNAFIDTFIGFHNITRFTSPEHPGVTWYYYFPILIAGFFPWTAILLQSVWASVRVGGSHWEKLTFLNVWAWFIFLFFTISRTKLVSYILPMYVPIAIITGWYVSTLMERHVRGGHRSWAVLLLIFALLFAGGLAAGAQEMPELTIGAYAAGAVFGLMGLAAAYLLWHRRIAGALWTQVAGIVLFVIILMSLMLPAAVPVFASKDIAADLTQHYDGKSPLYIVKFLRPGVAFYSGLYGVEVESNWGNAPLLADVLKRTGKAYFVVRDSHYSRMSPENRQTITVLAQKGDRMLLVKDR